MTSPARKIIQELKEQNQTRESLDLNQAEQNVANSQENLRTSLDHLQNKVIQVAERFSSAKHRITQPVDKAKDWIQNFRAYELKSVNLARVYFQRFESYAQEYPERIGILAGISAFGLLMGWRVGKK